MRKGYKRFTLFSLIIAFLFSSSSLQSFAEENKEPKETQTTVENSEKQEIELGPEDPMYGSSYGVYKGANIHYTLDIANPDELEAKGFFSNAWDFISLQVVDNTISESLHYSIFFVVDLTFKLNVFMTNVMLAILNFSYNTNNINTLIDNSAETIKNLTGITGTRFGSSGLFSGFLGLIGLFTALFTLYQFIVKKASISAFSSILKSIVALTFALLFFSNYADILKGANSISNDLSSALLSGSVDINMNESGVIESTSVRGKMNDNIFTMFVHRPYLMLQYGTTIEKNIGPSRVEELLTTKKGEERTNIVIKEVIERGNETLTYAGVMNRLVFVGVMTITNVISSIPIFLLAFFLVIFQYWFLVIALIAPYVFLWSALPNQFGVLKRYFFEMSIPLLLKMGLSVIALIIFGITDVLYNINTLGGGTQGYIITTLLQSLILFTLFLLRKRIFNVFSTGSRELNILREQMNSTFIEPMKKGASDTLTVGGAIIGGAVAGPQGAMLGANIGSSAGSAVSGETDLSGMAKDASTNMMLMERMNQRGQLNQNETDSNTREVILDESVASNNVSHQSTSYQKQFSSGIDQTTAGILTNQNELSPVPIQHGRMEKQVEQPVSLQDSKLESSPFYDSTLENTRPILDSEFMQNNQQYMIDEDDQSVNLEETNINPRK
jgi:hypothetical protein